MCGEIFSHLRSNSVAHEFSCFLEDARKVHTKVINFGCRHPTFKSEIGYFLRLCKSWHKQRFRGLLANVPLFVTKVTQKTGLLIGNIRKRVMKKLCKKLRTFTFEKKRSIVFGTLFGPQNDPFSGGHFLEKPLVNGSQK